MPFSEIIGQPAALSLLGRLLASGRLPHALLFVGPEGVGKHRSARALAQGLLCEGAGGAASPSLFEEAAPASGEGGCGGCPACRRIAQGQHPDVHEVGGSGAQGLISIDSVRELSRVLALHAVEGGAKVAIVDPAEKMRPAAANALLKTLEEPPKETFIVLIARERSLLLPTIVSRCQVVRFGLLDSRSLRRYFEARGEESPFSGRPELVRVALALAGGSIGKAVALSEGDFEGRRQVLGELLGGLESGVPEAPLLWAERLARLSKENSEAFADALEGLALFLRDVAARRVGTEPGALTSQDLLPQVERWSRALPLDRVLDRIEALLEIRGALEANAHKEMAALYLARRLALPHPRG